MTNEEFMAQMEENRKKTEAAHAKYLSELENVEIPGFGAGTYHPGIKELCGKTDWLGKTIEFVIMDEENDFEGILEYTSIINEIKKNEETWNDKVIKAAVDDLHDCVNNWIEGEEELTKEQFTEMLSVDRIDIFDGDVSFVLDDQDIFCGHIVSVEVDVEAGKCNDVRLEG